MGQTNCLLLLFFRLSFLAYFSLGQQIALLEERFHILNKDRNTCLTAVVGNDKNNLLLEFITCDASSNDQIWQQSTDGHWVNLGSYSCLMSDYDSAFGVFGRLTGCQVNNPNQVFIDQQLINIEDDVCLHECDSTARLTTNFACFIRKDDANEDWCDPVNNKNTKVIPQRVSFTENPNEPQGQSTDFNIKMTDNNSKCVSSIAGSSAIVYANCDEEAKNQKWQQLPVDDKTVIIKNSGTGLCLDITGNVVGSTCEVNAPTQHFTNNVLNSFNFASCLAKCDGSDSLCVFTDANNNWCDIEGKINQRTQYVSTNIGDPGALDSDKTISSEPPSLSSPPSSSPPSSSPPSSSPPSSSPPSSSPPPSSTLPPSSSPPPPSSPPPSSSFSFSSSLMTTSVSPTSTQVSTSATPSLESTADKDLALNAPVNTQSGSSDNSDDDGLSTAALVGIIIGSIIGVGLLIDFGIIIYCLHRRVKIMKEHVPPQTNQLLQSNASQTESQLSTPNQSVNYNSERVV